MYIVIYTYVHVLYKHVHVHIKAYIHVYKGCGVYTGVCVCVCVIVSVSISKSPALLHTTCDEFEGGTALHIAVSNLSLRATQILVQLHSIAHMHAYINYSDFRCAAYLRVLILMFFCAKTQKN